MNQIRFFLAVAKELHFTRAAASCNVSQPALTKSIQKLEDEFGGQLFFRERGTTQLTDLGRLVLPSLERAFDAANDARRQAEAFARRDTSPLRIGIELSIATPLLRPSLNAISHHCEALNLSLIQDGNAEICNQIIAGELDVAVLVDSDAIHDRLHRWPLFAERYIMAFPDDHPFHAQAAIDIRDLAGECLLLLQRPQCPATLKLMEMLKEHNVKPKREHLASTQEQIMELVLASLGICIAGEQTTLPAHVIGRPLTPDPGARQIVLAVAAGRPLGPTPGMFLKLMRTRAWPHVSAALSGGTA